MEPSALHSQIAVFEEKDNCLFFFLGLAVAASEMITWLESETNQTASPDVDSQIDGLIFFLLGLHSFSKNSYQSIYLNQTRSWQDNPDQPAARLPRLVIRDLLG